MKKRILTALCAGMLGAAVMISGTTGVFAAEAETAAEEVKTIGKDEKGAFCVNITNLTGKDVKAVKISENTQYDEKKNLLEEEDVFTAEEKRVLCYLPEVKEEKKDEEKAEKEQTVPVYNIQFTFADDTTAEIHTFPFGDVEACELHMEGEIAYIVFESISLKEEINTLETETKIADEIKAAAEAAAAAANSSDDYYEDYSNYDYSNAGSGSSSSGSGSTGGGDACLGGGIIF